MGWQCPGSGYLEPFSEPGFGGLEKKIHAKPETVFAWKKTNE